MTNSLAIGIGIVLAVGLAVDFIFFGQSGALFLARKGLDLLEWLAFWR
jgi:hypothetical protein